MSALVLHVRLHDGRYHGAGDWPPSPARLFQALVAGAGLGGALDHSRKSALEWLEGLGAPIIGVPKDRSGQRVQIFVPNNDGDTIQGDPARMAEIRTAIKASRPRLFSDRVPLIYAWPLAGPGGDNGFAHEICSLAERLYQLGRGIDMAWAWGELLDDRKLEDLFAHYPGRVLHPSSGRSNETMQSPCVGSLESLEQRYRAFGERFSYERKSRTSVKVTFRTPPPARFQLVPYDSPPSRQLYEFRTPTAEAAFAPWPLARAAALVVVLRDGAVERLTGALPKRKAEIERVLVGRKPDGANNGRPEDRVRIIPLPSVGHPHADREIRRVLVEVPATCSLRATDVSWAFSGLPLPDLLTGEVFATLTRVDDRSFLRHYGMRSDDHAYWMWRTVTPAALPQEARRRRIDPARKLDEAKAGSERADEQKRAARAVRQALRHAGVHTDVRSIRVQREPFEANGERVEAFAGGTRFAKQRIWHVEIAFEESTIGPLTIGDGRFLGLGVMAPVPQAPPPSRCSPPGSSGA